MHCVDLSQIQRTVCHGNGTCGSPRFVCECPPTVSEGEYCERCLTGYAANSIGQCVPEACMNGEYECSNHGMCVAFNDSISCMC